MKVILADEAGFCSGVERAVDEVKRGVSKGNSIATFGPLAHNPHVERLLKDLSSVDSILISK